jgi:dihydroorotase
MRTLIHNAEIITGVDNIVVKGWILIESDRIADIGSGELPQADFVVDACGDLIMPGMIDTHVHFREPGLTHKADIASESGAAVAGGVTSYFDMPNCVPATTTLAAWEQKMQIAKKVSHANYAFYIGATNTNFDKEILNADFTKIPGVKLFLGSSTGNLLVDSGDSLKKLFSGTKATISVHAEDNARISANAEELRKKYNGDFIPISMHPVIRDAKACVDSTKFAVSLAQETGAKLHILHVSTADEVELLRNLKNDNITAETCVQYLTFTSEDYSEHGARIKCNPAIKSEDDKLALIQALKDGVIELVASDHAPHLLEEKVGDALSAPSGMPNMQFQLVQLLDLFTPVEVVKMVSVKPAEVFNIKDRGTLVKGAYADIVRVAKSQQLITDKKSLSKCGWTPADGVISNYTIVTTWVNGKIAYDNQQISETINSLPIEFIEKIR